MATLEVHDGRGRVERVPLTRGEPLLFGSSSACTLVLDGSEVAPVHGRIRWQKRKLKLDAGADVGSIELNGRRVKSSSLHQGDEIRVGPCRIFVLNTEELVDDRTIIRPAPKAFPVPTGPNPAGARLKALFESDDVVTEALAPKERRKRRRERSRSPRVKPLKLDFWGKIKARVVGADDAPGQERIISSPVVVGLGVTLVVLVVLSVGLFRVIVKANAEAQYAKAFGSLDDGDYRNAVKQLDLFLTENPKDPRAGKARVYRALAVVRQFTAASGASWENALKAARAMVDQVGTLTEFRDASTELAEQLVKTAEGLADRARSAADPEPLAQAESALALHREVAGKPSEGLIARSRAPAKMAQARDAIRRAKVRAESLASIDAALKAGSPNQVYALRNRLIGVYPDLANDPEVVSRLGKANDLIRKGAKFDESSRPGQTIPNPEPLGPPTTLVLRLDPGRKPETAGSVVAAIADGLAFGLDGATGAPLWQVPVGLASPFPPLAIAGGAPAFLVFDARHKELIRIDGRTGALAWRQEIGEMIADPPLVVGNQVVQATPSGRVLDLDLATGALRGTLDLGRALTRTAVADESGEHLYLLGDEDCLFVLGRDPLSCEAVTYLGQTSRSIAATPARVGRFLVVPENTGIDDGRWRVFVIGEDGLSVSPRQTIPVAGWTWRTPPSAGSVIWSASDRGEVVAYSIGLHDAEVPFKTVAEVAADNEASGPAYGLSRTEHEFWLGAAHPSRFDLKPESGKMERAWTLGGVGPAVAPPQVAAKLLVLTQQSTDGPGVALWGLDPENGAVGWRTTLGSPWPIDLGPGKDPGSVETLGFDGRPLVLGADALKRGGFVEGALPKPGTFRLPSMGATRLTCGKTTVIVPEPNGDHILVRVGDGPFRAVDLPSRLGAPPIAWGDGLLVPGAIGRVFLIDPTTGESTADPYVPRFDRAKPARWRAPVAVDGDAAVLVDEQGVVRRLTIAPSPRRRLVVSSETNLGSAPAGDPVTSGRTVFIATADGKFRALAARDLSPAGSVELASARTLGPVVVSGLGFVGDAEGEVTVFSEAGRRALGVRLDAALVTPPAVRGETILFLNRSGVIDARKKSDGSEAGLTPLGILPAGPPIVSGTTLIVPTGLGSLRTLTDSPKGEKP